MTKKDFIAIAETLNLLFFYGTRDYGIEHFTDETAQAITSAFVAMLSRQNSRFDRDKFIKAVYKV